MGSPAGALKTAAVRVGVDVDEYNRRRAQDEKWCTFCKDWHPLSAFPADRSRGDGRRARCLVAERGRPRHREPIRDLARNRVNRSIRRGDLPRPNDVRCVDCGHVHTVGERRHEYDHHLGYEPEHHLSVEAVCTTCHADREIARKAR